MSQYALDDGELLLKILGNVTRRRIVQVLADEPKYFNQMLKEIGVGQKAVLEHLQMLEESGLIVSYRAKSDLGAPDRKYYKLNKTLLLTVSIGRKNVGVRIQMLPRFERELMLTGTTIIGLAARVQNVLNLSSFEETIRTSQPLLREIESRMNSMEEKIFLLAYLRQSLMEKLHAVIQEAIEPELERKVLYTLLNSSKPTGMKTLSQQLNIRERELEQALTRLQRHFNTPLTNIFENLSLPP